MLSLIIAATLLSQSVAEGCNTVTCASAGICTTTLLNCGWPIDSMSKIRWPVGAPESAVVPVEQIADPFSRDLAWIGAGASADLLSTSAALHWCSTCRETNPFGWDSEARIALKLGMSTAAGTTCWWLRRSGHGKAATIVRWTVFGIQGLATANNVRHAIRGR